MSDADGLPYVRGLMEADSNGAQSDGAGEKGVHVSYRDMILATAMLLCQLAQPRMGRLVQACRGRCPSSVPAGRRWCPARTHSAGGKRHERPEHQ